MPRENPDPQQNNQDDLNLLIGKSLGQYRIVERMGSGGIATVFKAYQPTLDRYVAVKVLPPSYARDPLFIKRFVGVLATEFHVPDSFAAAFAGVLYQHFLSGKPIGEALIETRRHFWTGKANPLGLAYALYSSPSIRIAK